MFGMFYEMFDQFHLIFHFWSIYFVFRDLKPENILLDSKVNLVLIQNKNLHIVI